MAINYWRAANVSIERSIYNRLKMLVEEVVALADLDTDKGINELTDEFASRIIKEYVRQHFEESTKTAAQLFKREISLID